MCAAVAILNWLLRSTRMHSTSPTHLKGGWLPTAALPAGGSLHAALAAAPRPMGENEIWRVLLHVALALHHMHSRCGGGGGGGGGG